MVQGKDAKNSQREHKKKMEWHNLLGIGLMDYFPELSYKVDSEIDLSLKQQRLDIVVIRRKDGQPIKDVCDGLEKLKKHNLITFKSFQETLDSWALDELTGHYVKYRKQISSSKSKRKLLPEDQFQLYGITSKYPRNLFRQSSPEKIKKGVYDLKWGSNVVRIIVLNQLPKEKRNALWHLYSGKSENIKYGIIHYKWRHKYLQYLIPELLIEYMKGGVPMSYTIDDFLRDTGNTEAIKYRAIELQLEKERREKEQFRSKAARFENEIEQLKKLLKEKGIDIH